MKFLMKLIIKKKKLIGQNDKKDNMNFFEKSYYFRQKNQENEGNENISSKTTNK